MTASGKLHDCCFAHSDKRLTHNDALALLKARVTPVVLPEAVELSRAAGRILAAPVIAPRNIPAHDYSAMDGYAFAYSGYDSAGGTWFELAGRVAAGHTFARPVTSGEALRILTGATMPEGADTVVMQEDVQLDGNRVYVPGGLKPGANRRLAGEDMRAGDVVAPRGARLHPQTIAAIAATGTDALQCYRRLKVAIVSTGDEIVRAGGPLGQGQVYDANGPMLAALAALTGAEITDFGVLPDRADIVRETLAHASQQFDAIVTSGGASHGDEDHIARSVQTLGELHLWELAIKPGKPMALGQISDCAFIGLPGNPVAAFACFVLYALPVLTALSGGEWREPRRYTLPAAFAIPSRKTGRREFLRGSLVVTPEGGLAVQRYPRDGSGLISSLQASDGLIEIPEDKTALALGERVDFIPYTELGIAFA